VFLTPPTWKRLADIPPGAENKDLARNAQSPGGRPTKISLPASATPTTLRSGRTDGGFVGGDRN
jgi:hypothetical protein